MATILYVDHDQAAQKLIQNTLSEQYNVIIAADGPTAVQYCAMIQPDLVLIDLALPDIEGHELVSRLKMFMPQTPILVIGNDNLERSESLSFSSNFSGFLNKPIQVDELLQSVHAVLPPLAPLPELLTPLPDDQAVKRFQFQIAALNQANQRLASLNAISALIGTSLDVEHLMDEILAQVQKTIDFDSATLLLLKGDFLEAAASRGFSDYRRGMNIYRRNEKNSAWHAVNNKLPLIIKDVTQSEYWEPRPELSRIRSWLGVPLIYKDRVVGVLTLDKNEPDAFTDTDARYVFTLAYQIGIAVENAQLFEEWEDQATRLKLINEVAREISTILEMNNLFEALAKAIYERLHYDRVAILQVDETRSFLILKAIYGEAPPSLTPGLYRQSIDDGLIGKAIRLGQSLLVNNVSKDSDVLTFEGMEIRSELVVPIFVENQVEAVINIDQSYAGGFSDHDLWTLNSLASQAATALANARLYRDLAQRLRDLAVLNDASQALTSTIALDELLAIITDRVCIALLAENGYVLLVDSSDDKLALAAASGSGAADLVATKLSIHLKLFEQAILEGVPCLFKLTPENPHLFAGLDQILHRKIQTMLVAPLKTRGIIIGLVILINKQTGDFGTNDLNLLSALSQLMAGAVENAQLFKQIHTYSDRLERTVQARTERLQAIKKISQVVSRGLDLDELLVVVGRDISQIFTPEFTQHDDVQVTIGLVDGSNLTLQKIYDPALLPRDASPNDRQKSAASAGLAQKSIRSARSLTLKIKPEKLMGQVIHQAKPLILTKEDSQNLYRVEFGQVDEQICTVMMAPLITGGKTIGLIMVASQMLYAFDESDLETLESLAFQVASAVEHAQLLQKTREIAIVEERTRLARDMHDGVAQNLAYLLIQVDRCLNMVEEGGKLEKQLEQISSLLKQNIEEIRRNIFDLRPVELEGKSLFAVLKNFVGEFGQRWNLKTTCVVEGEFVEVSPEIESSLYRILQEVLSNAQQHANCSQLSVKVSIKDNQWVTLEVQDDGQGFDLERQSRPDQQDQDSPKKRRSRGLGLISMRERAQRVGGQLIVDSQPSQGTCVFAKLPLQTSMSSDNQ
ncbi:MAG: GAF domain-containing protein [Anaerolineales bacterium]|nr:GAF domain-containing protein [Anaerolineales bacterium]